MTLAAAAVGMSTGSAEQLAAFLVALAASRDATGAMVVAAEHAAAAFGADVASVTRGDRTVSSRPPAVARVDGVTCDTVPLECPAGGEMRVVRRSGPLCPSEVTLLTSMARVLVMALELLDNREQERALLLSLRERQALLERLGRIQRSIFHRAPLQDVLDTITAGAAELLGDEVVGLRLLDPDDPTQLIMVSALGVRPAGASGPEWRTTVGEGVGGRAVSEARLVVVEDYGSAPFHLPAFAGDGVRSAMAAPVFEHGRIAGSLTIATRMAGRRWSPAEREILQTLAEHASLAVNSARTAEALRHTVGEAAHQATHDPLTGLANRAVVVERLEELLAVPATEGLAVLFVDLDRFKLVNDSLGHDEGDRVLVTTAERLRRCVRPGDLVARHAGDEFVVVCAGLRGEVEALGLADRICREIAMPMPLRSREVVVTASVGVARPGPGITADQLLRDADVAMYQAKERGRDRTALFGRSMRSKLLERVELEHSLRAGIARDEFRLHYQPAVSLGTGRPIMVEALICWEHPERGLVSPDEFIPVAEDSGLIVQLGAWVLRQACREVATWRTTSAELADMHVSVNLSACQFGDDHLVDLVASTLAASGLDPGALWLEITETAVMADVASTIGTLRALKALGVHVSIDDFGTGYSSLSYLKRFPVDVLKIDRSFVGGFGTDSEDEAIVTAVVRMAQALGKRVVAEGVENSRQLVGLSELGCDAAQGYFFSRPLPPDEVIAWLKGRLCVA